MLRSCFGRRVQGTWWIWPTSSSAWTARQRRKGSELTLDVHDFCQFSHSNYFRNITRRTDNIIFYSTWDPIWKLSLWFSLRFLWGIPVKHFCLTHFNPAQTLFNLSTLCKQNMKHISASHLLCKRSYTTYIYINCSFYIYTTYLSCLEL